VLNCSPGAHTHCSTLALCSNSVVSDVAHSQHGSLLGEGRNVPMPQATHSVELFKKKPALHSQCSTRNDAMADCESARHVRHAVFPIVVLYVSAAHEAHANSPSGVNPGLHSHPVWFALLAELFQQTWHTDIALSFPKRPSAHSSHSSASSESEKKPGAHAAHSASPSC
jgi:hypothetical protein